YRDGDVVRGRTYTYRLGIQEAGLESFFGETAVLAEDLRFALDSPSPNPAIDGRLHLRFTLPGTEPVTVEVLDIAGRRVAARTGAGSLGSQSTDLTGNDAAITPGLYWIRLRQSGRQASIRAVVLR